MSSSNSPDLAEQFRRRCGGGERESHRLRRHRHELPAALCWMSRAQQSIVAVPRSGGARLHSPLRTSQEGLRRKRGCVQDLEMYGREGSIGLLNHWRRKLPSKSILPKPNEIFKNRNGSPFSGGPHLSINIVDLWCAGKELPFVSLTGDSLPLFLIFRENFSSTRSSFSS